MLTSSSLYPQITFCKDGFESPKYLRQEKPDRQESIYTS